MSTISRPQNPESNPRVKAVFNDIRATRGSDFINNLWHYLAFDENLLEKTWYDVKAIMTEKSNLDPITKELIYIAVSITNSCVYCTRSHTAAAKKKGASDEMIKEMIDVVGIANQNNKLVEAYQVEVDEIYK